jgi:signal transduction histidine kinase
MYYHFRDILDYSQIINRSLLIFPQLCNLQDIINHAIDLHKMQAKEKKLELSLDKYSK